MAHSYDIVNDTVTGQRATCVRAIGAPAREHRPLVDVVLQLRRATPGAGKQGGYVYFGDDSGHPNPAVDPLVKDVGLTARSRGDGAKGTQ